MTPDRHFSTGRADNVVHLWPEGTPPRPSAHDESPPSGRNIVRLNDIRQLPTQPRALGDDDYRQRIITNAVGFLFCLLLFVIGAWLVNGILSMPRHVDCNFSVRRPCTAGPAAPEIPFVRR